MRSQTQSLCAFALVLVLAGCASQQSLYDWGPYEAQVYAYFKGASPDEQMQILERHLTEVEGKGTAVPPGFYAHLGMLYGKAGRDADAQRMLAMETQLYPESITFIQNLRSGFEGAK